VHIFHTTVERGHQSVPTDHLKIFMEKGEKGKESYVLDNTTSYIWREYKPTYFSEKHLITLVQKA
jgi:hypothetical protein